MKRSLFVLLGIQLCVLPAAFSQNCQLKKPNDVLEHIKVHHPEIKAENLKTETYKKAIEKSAQRPNPKIEMSSKSRSGELGGEGTSLGGEFKHVFELGGKREARINLSQSRLKEQKVSAQKTKEAAILSSIKTMSKLSQMNQLEALYKESIQSFKDLLQNLKNLPSKSPKETVEISTLEVVIQDYKIKKSRLQSMQQTLRSHLKFFVKEGCQFSENIFKRTATLPPLNGSATAKIDEGVDYKVSQMKVKTQKKRFELEKSQGWSNLELGPAIDYSDGGFSDIGKELKVGVALEFALPLFHTNDGGKAQALKRLKEKNLRLKNTKKELSLELKRRGRNYRNYTQQLEKLESLSSIQQKHQKIESFFSRGIISTNMIIEIHRQLINWHRDKFQFQRLAVDSLWRIYQLTGKTENSRY